MCSLNETVGTLVFCTRTWKKKAPRVNIWCKVFICERGILYLEQAVSNLSQSKSVLKVSEVLYSIAIITWSDVCVCVCVCVCVRARAQRVRTYVYTRTDTAFSKTRTMQGTQLIFLASFLTNTSYRPLIHLRQSDRSFNTANIIFPFTVWQTYFTHAPFSVEVWLHQTPY